MIDALLKHEPIAGLETTRKTRQGMKAAIEHGKKLPAFPNLESAQLTLESERNELIQRLSQAARESTIFSPDFSPESLKTLEKWYFELCSSRSFNAIGMIRDDFERSLAMYFGEVLVRNLPAYSWFVTEYEFEAGKYQIGVKKPLESIMLGSFSHLPLLTNNKRQQSMWRKYKAYAT